MLHKRIAIIAGASILSIVIVRPLMPSFARMIIPVYGDTVGAAFQLNSQLRHRVAALESTVASHEADGDTIALLRSENAALKAELGRSVGSKKGVIANVVTSPNRSIYDTFLIDAGSAEGIAVGQQVVAFTAVAIGTVVSVAEHAATVQLHSAPGNQIAGNAAEGNVAVSLIGRGAGEYEVHMPRSVPFTIGDAISTQSIDPLVLADIEKIETDPRDPFQRLLAKAPVTLSSLKWVIVR